MSRSVTRVSIVPHEGPGVARSQRIAAKPLGGSSRGFEPRNVVNRLDVDSSQLLHLYASRPLVPRENH